ncbi:hypothetical protein [Kiloniella majae]|uniref:hypothetical protein n=1 Tax=Kiloniella majae TaxID=1938558 RepID=UPI000A276FA0|nr:hypothetical protein [Kiloniella majae]
MKYTPAEDLQPDLSIGFSLTQPKGSETRDLKQLTPKYKTAKDNNIDEKIQLTPTPYAVFKALADAPGQELSYGVLKINSGMAKVNSFPKHIQELVAKGVIQCLGPHRDRYVILRVDPARIEKVKRYARKTSQHSRPDCQNGHQSTSKERKCLSCQKSFKSEWIGMRICGDCKLTPAWQDPDNPYTPEGDTDGSGLSDLTMGLY